MRVVFEGTLEEFETMFHARRPTAPFVAPIPAPILETVRMEDPGSSIDPDPVPSPATEATPPVKRGPGRPRKIVAPIPAPTPVEEPIDPEVVPTPTPTISREDVVAAAEELIRVAGIPAAKALLGTFGVSKLPDVPQTMWAAFIEKAKERAQ